MLVKGEMEGKFGESKVVNSIRLTFVMGGMHPKQAGMKKETNQSDLDSEEVAIFLTMILRETRPDLETLLDW